MTKVEAIDYLDNYRKMYADLAPEKFLEALDILLSEYKLPEDMDEAMDKNFETMEVFEHENIFEETHHKIFKSGVEWMTGQGITSEGIINQTSGEDTIIELNEYIDLEDCEEVIVQIRKK